jgi:hypothetical protein
MRVIPIRAKKLPEVVDPKNMQGPLDSAARQSPTIGELEMLATPGPNLAALNI